LSDNEARNLKILEMHLSHMTNVAIAERVGLTPERVRQIVSEMKKSMNV
tara:strand:+ start:236 stop:382 length:147 start_codon:yes stop_codon:yes gene_type:complete